MANSRHGRTQIKDGDTFVVAEGNDPPGLAYIAPYAATSIAEYFMEAGRNVLIVYDDLTQHALAYAQFEELETFARFGARPDEENRNVIEHGRRIRACLKQAEFAPVSMSEQITVLLALSAKLFDAVPLEAMTAAEQRVRDAASTIPREAVTRLDTAEKLSDEDRDVIIEIARQALEKFRSKPDSKPAPVQKNDAAAKEPSSATSSRT
jgi:F0F1-type ATP synthase alpha subunit